METATFSGRRGIAYRRAVPARVPGWRLVLDKPGIVPVGHGFANIVPDDAAAVLGVLYEIRTVELDHLDLSEGVLIGNYRRVEVVAETLTSRATKVGAQTFASDRRDVSLRPSTRYLACLIAGALEHGLPAAYVEWLRARVRGKRRDRRVSPSPRRRAPAPTLKLSHAITAHRGWRARG